MKLSTVHKQRLARIGRVTMAAALVAGSVVSTLSTPAEAALSQNITAITDSRPGQTTVGYNIRFTPSASALTPIDLVTVRFCEDSGSWSSCVGPDGLVVDMDLSNATASGFGGSSDPTDGTFNRIGDNEFTFEVDTPDSETQIPHILDLPGLLANPANAGTYYVMVRTTSAVPATIDEGTSAFAIVDKVDVTGRVAESMVFTVNGVATGQPCGGTENASVTSTATSVPFGNFTSGTPRVACQTISVATNAVSGYSTSVKHVRQGASPMGGMCRQTSTDCSPNGAQSTTPAADVIVDDGLSSTAAAWTPNTTFGVGLNANGGHAHTDFGGGSQYKSMFTTPKTVAVNTGPTTATSTTIKLKADVPADQTAGVYQNSFEYITTPTF